MRHPVKGLAKPAANVYTYSIPISRRMISLRKKKLPLFGSGIEPRCEYCAHNLCPPGPPVCRFGLDTEDAEDCRRFGYDPLLRKPKVQPPLPEFDPEEFKL